MHSLTILFFLAVPAGASATLWSQVRKDWSHIKAALGFRAAKPGAALLPQSA